MSVVLGEQFSDITVGNTTAGNYDIVCAQAGNINQAVCVLIHQNTVVTDLVTSVTFGLGAGAVARTRDRFDTEATEPGGCYIYWAGWPLTLPTGTQTCRIVRTGTANIGAAVFMLRSSTPSAFAVTRDTSASGSSASSANPSWTMTTPDATPTFCFEIIHSGLNAITTTPASGWTRADTLDMGNQGRGVAYRAATGGAVTCGWTASTADDFVGSSISFLEIPAPVSGGSRQPYVNRRAVVRAATW